MAINWFPGHMHKARKEITAILPKVDFLIELVDARIPYSSGNPLIAELRDQKPLLKLLNKSDLADANVTQKWIEYFESETGVIAIPFDAKHLCPSIVTAVRNSLVATQILQDYNNGCGHLMLVSLPSSTAWLADSLKRVTCRLSQSASALRRPDYILLDTPVSGPNYARNLWQSVGRHGRH